MAQSSVSSAHLQGPIEIDVAPPSVDRFNAIPDVGKTHHVYYETAALQHSLNALATELGVDDKWKACTLHKHFPLKDGHLLLISTEKLQDGQEVELARPVGANKAGAVHPISFFVEADGTVRAYKFAPGFRALTEAEKRFFCEASSRLMSTGEHQRVSFKRPTSKGGVPTTEFEIPSHKATVLFPQSYVRLCYDGPVQEKETAKNETHNLTVKGTHNVLFKHQANPFSECVMSVLFAESSA